MNKSQLTEKIAHDVDLTKQKAGSALDSFIDVITESLKEGDKVSLVGFGTFEPRKRSARKGRNPQTGAEINIAAAITPAFKAGKDFKDAVN
jgi:DNA-binding protein HU-beta